MNDHERELARLGMAALNASLARLGYPPVGENPHVRMADPAVLDFPNAVVDKPGVAPLRFLFGYHLDVWIGPFSEVLDIPVTAETTGHIEDLITRVLRSEVFCRDRWKSIELILQVPGQDPWRKLRVFGVDSVSPLEPRHAPYAPQSRP